VDLLAYGSTLFFVESAQRLLHGSGSSSNIQRVLGDIPRYARHVRGTPRENVGVRAEKVDEHCFLFGIELGADPDLLGGVAAGVEGTDLTVSAGSKLLAWRFTSGASLERLSRSAMRASAYSTHSMSHSNVCRYVGPTVMTPLGPRIMSLR
jgi:hypothetical protein